MNDVATQLQVIGRETPPAPHHAKSPEYRADIDGLRGIAVLAVVAFHAFPEQAPGGFVGVDVFFVVSGFLISTIILAGLSVGNFGFLEFYSRRIRRIFPALLTVLGACLAIGWFLLLAADYKELGKHIAGGAGFVSNFILWTESGYFDNAVFNKPLLHLWSLGIEEQFYLVWPPLLWIIWKYRPSLPFIIVTTVATSFTLNIAYSQTDLTSAFFLPQTRFWEIGAGALLAYAAFYQITPLHRSQFMLPHLVYNNSSVLGATAILISVFLVTKDDVFPGWWALLPVAGAVLIIGSDSTAWFNRKVLSNKALVWVGLISFPLYLWHWPLISLPRIVGVEPLSIGTRIAAIATSIVLASLTYNLIEKPIRFGRHRSLMTLPLCVLLLFVGIGGYAIYYTNGFSNRLPKLVQELSFYSSDSGEVYGKLYRARQCILEPDQDASAFSDCTSTPANGEFDKSIFLWGDSHAAHLYPGLLKRFGKTNKLTQLAASYCAPIMGMWWAPRPHCKSINDWILQRICKERPDEVILAASWPGYDWKKIDTTIQALRYCGIVGVILVGPVPRWQNGLPTRLARFILTNDRGADIRIGELPERMRSGLNMDVPSVERGMTSYAKHNGVIYVSPWQLFCNQDGCLTRLGNSIDSLTAWDDAHLTVKASAFLASKFPKLAK